MTLKRGSKRLRSSTSDGPNKRIKSVEGSAFLVIVKSTTSPDCSYHGAFHLCGSVSHGRTTVKNTTGNMPDSQRVVRRWRERKFMQPEILRVPLVIWIRAIIIASLRRSRRPSAAKRHAEGTWRIAEFASIVASQEPRNSQGYLILMIALLPDLVAPLRISMSCRSSITGNRFILHINILWVKLAWIYRYFGRLTRILYLSLMWK